MTDTLQRYTRRLTEEELANALSGEAAPYNAEAVVVRGEAGSVALTAFDALMQEFHGRREKHEWSRPDDSDRWLAPRLHYALRLSRAEAADIGIWVWLLVRDGTYVEWRWGKSGTISIDRWYGSMNKQALARLWWGAELFRSGSDYEPVERSFILQDLINSLLHRPLVRCRPLAQGIVDVLVPPQGKPRGADDVNDLARVLNLTTAGAPPEAETGVMRDDTSAYEQWLADVPAVPKDWSKLPSGPPASDMTEDAHEAGIEVVERGWKFAHAAAEAAGTRSARRRTPTKDDRDSGTA